MIAEISDTTLGRDRFAEGLAYAKAGILQYIVLNVQEEVVEDYREPDADGYGSKRVFQKGESFSLASFSGIEIKVDDLF